VTRRILCIAPSAYLLGGAQTWLDYLLPGLVDRGWQVTLGLVSGRLHDADAYLASHPFAPTIRIAAPTGTREGRVRALARSIQENRPDLVVVLNIADAYEAVVRLRAERATRAKVVATLHGIQPDFLEDFSRFRKQLDAVVCTNRLAVVLVRESSGVAPERVLYSPYGVDLSAWQPDRRDRSDRLRIAYSGRLESSQKRILDVGKILRSGLDRGLDLTLSVAGAGLEEARFKAVIDRYGLSNRVTFHGVLDFPELRHVYQASDVMLLTSSWETGPIVAWEAMSEHLPLVTSDFLGRRREGSLADGVNCLVFPIGNVHAAVQCLQFMQDVGLRRRLALAGRELVESRYTRQHSIDQWSRCLEAVGSLPALCNEGESDKPTPAGRLDRWFGPRFGETLRSSLGQRYLHREPGGEWPHSYGTNRFDDAAFLDLARRLDQSLAEQ